VSPCRRLVPNPKNWRRHPQAQRDALDGVLIELGCADALTVRELPNGRLMIVDGNCARTSIPMLRECGGGGEVCLITNKP
jgi:hypothetical protein